MKLTRLSVSEFKRFRAAFELDGFSAGLNLFVGPNEAGKSTLVEAIRSAFFERHRANLDALRPWGDSTAAPTIGLSFEHQGKHYQLEKRFLKKARCQLSIDDTLYEGDDAEDQLKQLLGFTQSARGASSQRDWGIPGLLWVQQGSAQEIASPVAEAADRLRSVLEGMISEVASTSGDALIQQLQKQRDELLTPSTGKPRGDYDQAIKESTRLGEELVQLETDIKRYCQQVDELSRLKQEQQDEARTAPGEALKQQLAKASAALEQLNGLQQRISAEKNAISQLDMQLELLDEHLGNYHTEQTQHETLKQQCTQGKQAVQLAQQQLHAASAQCEALYARRQQQRTQLLNARQLAQQRALRERLTVLDTELNRSTQRLAQAESAWQQLSELERRLHALAIDERSVNALAADCQALNELAIQRRAQATLLAYQLAADAALSMDDQPLKNSGEIELTRTTTLHIKGVGQLQITPGGADLEQLEQRHTQLDHKVNDQLQALQVDSLAAARERLAQQRDLVGELKLQKARFNDLAPQGLDPLRQAVALQQSERAEVSKRLAPKGEPGMFTAGQPTDDTANTQGAGSGNQPFAEGIDALASAETAELDEAVLEQQQARLDTDIQRADTRLNEAKVSHARAELELTRCNEARTTLEKRLHDPQREQRKREIQQNRDAQASERNQRISQLETLESELAAAQPALLKQDVERLQLSIAQLERQRNERRDMITRLEGELSSLGAQGLEEKRAEVDSELARQRHRVIQYKRRTQALDLLLNRLNAKRQHLVQQLQAPLLEKITHYLRILLPEVRLELNDALAPARLIRGNGHHSENGPLDDFSFGAREQLGVISRLAYADLLHENGHPTLIILDDALVHSDSDRLSSMKQVLFDAARRHQILIFSCHPAAWQDIGVEARRISPIQAS